MKVIDLLNMIVKGEEVPKKVKVLDQTLLPEYQIITWNEDLNLYEYCDGCEFDRVLDKHHLEKYIEIIEDKNIKKLNTNYQYSFAEHLEQETIYIICKKINEIIDKVNGE